jgi:four helix bundle protein
MNDKKPKKHKKYDLEERLIRFAVAILELVDMLPNSRAGNHIANQIVKSGTSPAPNYGEAQGAESRKDFIHKMNIGLKELRETFASLKIIKLKSMVKSEAKLNWLINECDELISIFVSSVKTARKNEKIQKTT